MKLGSEACFVGLAGPTPSPTHLPLFCLITQNVSLHSLNFKKVILPFNFFYFRFSHENALQNDEWILKIIIVYVSFIYLQEKKASNEMFHFIRCIKCKRTQNEILVAYRMYKFTLDMKGVVKVLFYTCHPQRCPNKRGVKVFLVQFSSFFILIDVILCKSYELNVNVSIFWKS